MPRVVVIGSANADIVVRVGRHPRVGETVVGHSMHIGVGGKGLNQAIAAARLGAMTSFVGCIGTDANGVMLRNALTASGVDCTGVVERGAAPTGTAIVTVDDDGANAIVVVPGANAHLTPEDVFRAAITSGDIVVAQLEVPIAAIEAALRRARAAGARSIFNVAPAHPEAAPLLDLTDITVMNEHELSVMTGARITSDTPDNNVQLSAALAAAKRFPEQCIVVTLGARGVAAMSTDELIEIRGRSVPVADTTGAGDCFVGAFAARCAAGDTLRDALGYANVAAALQVQRPGTAAAMPTSAEVRAAR